MKDVLPDLSKGYDEKLKSKAYKWVFGRQTKMGGNIDLMVV